MDVCPLFTLDVDFLFKLLVLASEHFKFFLVGLSAGAEFLFEHLFVHIFSCLLGMLQVYFMLVFGDLEPLF